MVPRRASQVLRRFEEPRQEGEAVRFGASYRSGMKAVIVAGAARKISQRWGVLTLKPACQRRDGINNDGLLDGCSATLGESVGDEGGGVMAEQFGF